MRVRGRGPVPCEVALVGEGPGYQEDRTGECFVGKTGEELNRFLDGTRLPARDDIFVTNLFREYQGKDHEWTDEDFARDEPELRDELARVRPAVIIAMGRWSTRYFLGDVDMDDVHGLPWYAPNDCVYLEDGDIIIAPDARVIFPLFHIASGFHNPEAAGFVLYDFQQLIAFFAGALRPRALYDDPYPNPAYTEITRPSEMRIDSTRPIAIDTEGSAQFPWSLQWSQSEGTAFVIRASHRACVQAFGIRLRRHRAPLIYHNALHDLDVMRALGIETSDLPFDDTMVMAYLLQVEPKGLKPLCTRHCNMKMQSYEEVLGDASQRIARDYFAALWDIEAADYEQRQIEAFADALAAGRRVKVLPKLPKTPLHRAVERALRSRTPRDLWEKWTDTQPDIQAIAVGKLGFMPHATLDHVDRPTAIVYGGRDADGTGRLAPELRARVRAQGLEDVYRLELSTYPFIDRMARIGIKPDLAHFATLSRDLDFEIADRQMKLEQLTGIEGFNANSGDQVATYLFDVLGLSGYKKTDSGRFSTDDKVLEALEREHPELPVISEIRGYREVFKLKYTFVDQMPAFTHRWPYDGRIHATFRTTRVVSGRLAASEPNLLAQPKHGTFAKRFRQGWVAEEGHLLGEWDLSQIELRILAHLSQDPVMLAIFRRERRNPDGSPIDLHALLAERIFGVKPSQQDKSQHRLPAKAVNFGLPMGMQAKGLMLELRKNGVMLDEDDAQRWIDETMGLYKGVPQYQERMKAEARRQGFIRCLSGRIRYIGGIKSRDEYIRGEAERFAFATPIQEGAQWLMKRAEAAMWHEIILPAERRADWIQPILQVHDAVYLEFQEDREQAIRLNQAMIDILTRTPEGFSVPIETSGECGRNLAELEVF